MRRFGLWRQAVVQLHQRRAASLCRAPHKTIPISSGPTGASRSSYLAHASRFSSKQQHMMSGSRITRPAHTGPSPDTLPFAPGDEDCGLDHAAHTTTAFKALRELGAPATQQQYCQPPHQKYLPLCKTATPDSCWAPTSTHCFYFWKGKLSGTLF